MTRDTIVGIVGITIVVGVVVLTSAWDRYKDRLDQTRKSNANAGTPSQSSTLRMAIGIVLGCFLVAATCNEFTGLYSGKRFISSVGLDIDITRYRTGHVVTWPNQVQVITASTLGYPFLFLGLAFVAFGGMALRHRTNAERKRSWFGLAIAVATCLVAGYYFREPSSLLMEDMLRQEALWQRDLVLSIAQQEHGVDEYFKFSWLAGVLSATAAYLLVRNLARIQAWLNRLLNAKG